MKILITGGSRGIGAACVRRFCQEGHTVAFFYRSRREAAEALARETGAMALAVDVSDPQSVKAGVEAVVATIGAPDVLVNNAGISHSALMTELTDADWRAMMGVNLDGCFYVTRAVAPHMIRAQGGRIILIGSVWGRTGASMEVHYSASKAALRGMTRALAKELGPSHITVNCVEPGWIDTDMNAEYAPEEREAFAGETPLLRIGNPEEVAAAVHFLASEEAAFITGQCLGVDGGYGI